jgi:hypothetical protein
MHRSSARSWWARRKWRGSEGGGWSRGSQWLPDRWCIACVAAAADQYPRFLDRRGQEVRLSLDHNVGSRGDINRVLCVIF